MKRLAPYRRPLITFTVVGMVTAFLMGWLEVGKLLAGVATAVLVAVALGTGFALFARVLAVGLPSLDRARSRAAAAQHQSAAAQDQSACAQSHDVHTGRDGGEHLQ
jgi:hypothetical protein